VAHLTHLVHTHMATTNLLQAVCVGQGTTATTISTALHADLGNFGHISLLITSIPTNYILEAISFLVPLRTWQLILFIRYLFQARLEGCQAPWRPRACPTCSQLTQARPEFA